MSLYSNISQAGETATGFLEGLPLFAGLKQEQLCELGQRMRRRSFAPGVTLFHQDMPGTSLYLLEKGCVRAFIIGRTGIEITVNVFGPNDVFGELSFVDNKSHSATTVTLDRCDIWLLAWQDLQEFLDRYPVIARSFLKILTGRVRATTHLVEAMAFQDVQGRLAYQILILAERHGRQSPDGIEIAPPLTQAELATMVAATRESVNKALTVLRSNDLIKIEGSLLTVTDVEGLRKVIHERGR